MRHTPIFVAALACVTATPLAAQTVSGQLLDAATRTPIVWGTLSLLGDGNALISVVTDADGRFVLRAPHAGSYRLRAEHIAYRTAETAPLDLADDDTLRVEFRLSMQAVVLSPITVVGYSRRPSGAYGGFYERARSNIGGHFITRAQIDKQMPLNTTDLLRMVPGVTLAPSRGGGYVVVLRGDCVPRVFLDGVPLGRWDGSIDVLVRPMDLEGIEIYRGAAELPAQFASACGAVVLWTRMQ